MLADRRDRETRHRERKRKKASTISPAAAEEGKAKGFWHNVRGGGTNASTSYDGYYKDDAYYEKPPKKRFWTKKKICKWTRLDTLLKLID